MDDQAIYLDHNSSAPLCPEAFEAMRPFLVDVQGNAASSHAVGRRLAEAVAEAREALAALIGSAPDEIVFTSGGTESNNWVMNGVGPGHVVVTAVEHFSVLENARRRAARGGSATIVPVSLEGRVDPAAVAAALREDTRLVSVMLAQNEVGTVEPVTAVAQAARARGVLVHTDASQAVGKIPVDVAQLGVDLLTIAGHKLYGPKGIGALYIRRGVELEPWMLGAPHEKGLRAGTQNVPGIVGLGAATRVAAAKLPVEGPRLRELSKRFHAALASRVPGLLLNGPGLDDLDRLPNTVNVSFPRVAGFTLLTRVPDVLATPGAACHSGEPSPSSTLLAMGLAKERAGGAIRFSLGRASTAAALDRAAALVATAWHELQGDSK
ncbi:MAG: cysteine desulfurase [Vicinamibacteria bacterium]|nr:cysteine desulfurase [Vicinamibacteria bacterium]